MKPSLPTFLNLGLVVFIVVLEIGLFRIVSRRGAARAFWVGFEVAGWACVIASSVFARTIWLQARSLFEGYLLGREIGLPPDMGRFVLLVGALHLLTSLLIACCAGFLARATWRSWESSRESTVQSSEYRDRGRAMQKKQEIKPLPHPVPLWSGGR